MTNEIITQKKAIRKEIRKAKKKLLESERLEFSDKIMSKLASDPNFISSKYIFIYWPMKDEVETSKFIKKYSHEKTFILPVVKGDELELRLFKNESELVACGKYEILEPTGEPFTEIEKIELVIVPGVAFDKNLNRLGRGKGYYDKILAQLANKVSFIALAFDFQIIDKIPTEKHDIKMNKIITNK